jgi:Glyoxalase/Bleomycin resistance protein/Dioxygenase superfamily
MMHRRSSICQGGQDGQSAALAQRLGSRRRGGLYSRLFGTQPAKLKPGYANFAIDDPPLKLVLNAPGNGPGATINHLGVEVESAEQVDHATRRLQDAGLCPVPEDEARCCYARQTKVWANDPDGAAWEFYTVLADLDTPDGQPAAAQAASGQPGGALTFGRQAMLAG